MLSRRQFRTIIAIAFALCFASIAQARPVCKKQQEPPKIVRKSGGVIMNEATDRPQPNYPPLAKAARVSGAVVVEVTISEGGDVIAARALSGHPLLKDSAVTAAKQWRFKPTLLSGEPVKVIGTITFNYNLPDSTGEIEAIKEAIRSNPNSAELHHKLGLAYRSDNQFESAIEAFNQAIQLNPNYIEALFELSRTYRFQKNLDKAIEVLKQSLAADPNNAETQMEMARVYWQAEMAEEALDAAKQALSLDSNLLRHVEPHIIMGLAHFNQNRFAEALDAFKQAAKLNPNMTQIRVHLAKAYFMTGDREAAMNEYKLLREKDPEAASRLREFLDKR
jgi:TonB family protein